MSQIKSRIFIFITFFLIQWENNYLSSGIDLTDLLIPPESGRIESDLPTYYSSTEDNVEKTVSLNRISSCEDHSMVKNVCKMANNSCFCHEHEEYAFSFCRKSCRFCDSDRRGSYSIYKILIDSEFSPSLVVRDLKFYSEYPNEESLLTVFNFTASSSFPGYHPYSLFDNDNNTYWMPEDWTNHHANSTWITVSFNESVKINAVQFTIKEINDMIPPKLFHLEASHYMNHSFINKWSNSPQIINDSYLIVRPSCPPLWRKFYYNQRNYCFKIFSKHLPWFQAEKECNQHNSTLASINGLEEFDFIRNNLSLCGLSWIGLNDVNKIGRYEWSDNSNLTFSRWADNFYENNRTKRLEECVMMDIKGRWSTDQCRNTHHFICKKLSNPYEIPPKEDAENKIQPPIVFLPDNFYKPLKNSSDVYNSITNYTLHWSSAIMVPVKTYNSTDPKIDYLRQHLKNLSLIPSEISLRNKNLSDKMERQSSTRHFSKLKLNLAV